MTTNLLRGEVHIIVIFLFTQQCVLMVNNNEHEAPTWATPFEVGGDTDIRHLQTQVPVIRMSQHAFARFGLAGARACPMGVSPGFPLAAKV